MDDIEEILLTTLVVVAVIAAMVFGNRIDDSFNDLADRVDRIEYRIDKVEADARKDEAEPLEPFDSNPPLSEREINPEEGGRIRPYGEIGRINCDMLREFAADNEARGEFISDNLDEHFSIDAKCNETGEFSLLLTLLEAGFEELTLSARCPEKYTAYAQDHLESYPDAQVEVVLFELDTSYAVDAVIRESGETLIEYAGYRCSDESFYPDDSNFL